jgi:hypothetical protein
LLSLEFPRSWPLRRRASQLLDPLLSLSVFIDF